jgi:hypothetical protein
MGQISLSIPISGQPNSTEDAKVSTDLTTIQTVINGNLDDTNFASPNSALRRVILQATGCISAGTSAGDVLFNGASVIGSGSATGFPATLWQGDAGYSAQPQDYQVAGKTAYGRVRVGLATNATGCGVTLTFGLYLLTAFSGVAGSSVAYSFGSAVAGTTVAVASPGAGTNVGAESAQFTLPVTSGAYALGVNLNGLTNTNSFVVCTAQLLAYNA